MLEVTVFYNMAKCLIPYTSEQWEEDVKYLMLHNSLRY